jgi:hypothetical protein
MYTTLILHNKRHLNEFWLNMEMHSERITIIDFLTFGRLSGLRPDSPPLGRVPGFFALASLHSARAHGRGQLSPTSSKRVPSFPASLSLLRSPSSAVVCYGGGISCRDFQLAGYDGADAERQSQEQVLRAFLC